MCIYYENCLLFTGCTSVLVSCHVSACWIKCSWHSTILGWTNNKFLLKESLLLLQVNHFRNQHDIHVYGTDIAGPVATFDQLQAEYSIDARVMSNLQSMGFHTPTVVEMQAIPIMLHVCCAYSLVSASHTLHYRPSDSKTVIISAARGGGMAEW